MPGGWFRRLVGGGSIVAALERDVAGERVLFLSEPVRSVKRFSGRVPGYRAGVAKTWFRAAFAVTDRRVVAFSRGSRIVDVGYEMESGGPATLTLGAEGLEVVWDLDRVHPACHGELKLDINAQVPDLTLTAFPATKISFDVDPQTVVRFTGSRRKLPAQAG